MDPENRAQIAGNPLRGWQICCATDLWLLWSSPALRWLLRLADGLREEARSAEFGIERYLPAVAHSHSGWVRLKLRELSGSKAVHHDECSIRSLTAIV